MRGIQLCVNVSFSQNVLESKGCQLFEVCPLLVRLFIFVLIYILIFFFSFLLQYVFRTKSFEERTVHEELAKNMTGLLKLNDQVTVKQVLKVNNTELAHL